MFFNSLREALGWWGVPSPASEAKGAENLSCVCIRLSLIRAGISVPVLHSYLLSLVSEIHFFVA